MVPAALRHRRVQRENWMSAHCVLLMVCDQPNVTPRHLQALFSTYVQSDRKIVASSYANTIGVPAVFGRSFFSNILMLKDEEGAKRIIAQFSEQTTAVPFPEGAIDLDTMEDYARFRAQGTP